MDRVVIRRLRRISHWCLEAGKPADQEVFRKVAVNNDVVQNTEKDER